MAELKDPLKDYTLAQLYALPPEQQQQLLLEYQEYQRRKREEEQAKIDEANKPNTAAQNAVGAIAGPAATIGGYYAANQLFGTGGALASGTAAGTGAGAAGAGAAGAGAGAAGASGAGAAATGGAAAGTGAATGTAAAGSVPAAPSVVAVNTVPASGSALGTAASYAWPALAAYGAYRAYDKTSQNLKESDGGPLTDSEIYYQFQPTGLAALGDTLTGGYRSRLHNVGISPIGPMSLVIRDWLGSSKEENQIYRDRVRKDLKKRGFLNDNYEITTPGGAYNIGIEGNDQFKDGGKPRFAGEHRYDVDVGSLDAQGHNLYGIADALANAGVMGDEKRRQQFAGYFMNAANVGGDALSNMQSIAQQLGLDYNQAMTNLNQRTDLSPEQRAQYQNGINMLFKQDKYSDPGFFNQAFGGTTSAGSPSTSKAPEKEDPKATALQQALSQVQENTNSQTFAGGRGVTKGGGPLVMGQSNRPGRSIDPGFNQKFPAGQVNIPQILLNAPPGGMNPNPELGQTVPAQMARGGRTVLPGNRTIPMYQLANMLIQRGAQQPEQAQQAQQAQMVPKWGSQPTWRMLPPR